MIKSVTFQKKRFKELNKVSLESKIVLLEPNDVVLVRKMSCTGKHKIQNRWEDEEYTIVSQPNSAIPVYIVQPVVGSKQNST